MHLRRKYGLIPLGLGFFVLILIIYIISVTLFQAKLVPSLKRGNGLVSNNVQNPEVNHMDKSPADFPVFDPQDQGQRYDPMKIHRIVHFDLKGAPPTIQYMKALFPLLRSLGATGLLMEYEDMFPYWGELSVLARNNAYNASTIAEIIQSAHDNKLIVIPLVQTFGHFEFVLKHKQFSYLREAPDRIQNLNPALPESMRIVSLMIDQMLALHPRSQYIHIGCDEVRSLGVSPESAKLMKQRHMRPEDLYLYHVTNVLKYVKEKSPLVTSLMWDDMLRHFGTGKLSNLGSLVEPMVWLYTPQVVKRFTPSFWSNYAKVFNTVWTASSFKGATGQAQYIVDIGYHVSNNAAWGVVMQRTHTAHFPRMKIAGIVLTGWQRYDHVLPLCELLPVAVPSLAVNLHVIMHGRSDKTFLERPSKLLQCTKPLPLKLPSTESDLVKCNFPGSNIYHAISELRLTRIAIEAFLKRGVRDDEKRNLIKQRVLHHVNHMPRVLQESLDPETVAEFIDINVMQALNKLTDIRREAHDLMSHRFPWIRPPRQS